MPLKAMHKMMEVIRLGDYDVFLGFVHNSALDCNLYRWHLLVYFTFPSV